MPRIRNVLAATDLSAASDRVVRTAADLALRGGGQLHVVHVAELPPGIPVSVLGGGAGLDLAVQTDLHIQASKRLQAQLEQVVPPGQRYSSDLVEGESVHGAICRRARDLAADLIVMGPHRPEKGAAGLLGTSADNVLRSASVPVLVVRGTVPVPARRVLAAVDPAEFSAALVKTAAAWGDAFSARTDGVPPTTVEVAYVLADDVPGGMPFDRARVLRGSAPPPVSGMPPGVEPGELVLWGRGAADTLLAYARETRPDLLVAGSHGRGAIRRALLGGTSSALARHAPCSVLLLPPSLWADSAARESGVTLV